MGKKNTDSLGPYIEIEHEGYHLTKRQNQKRVLESRPLDLLDNLKDIRFRLEIICSQDWISGWRLKPHGIISGQSGHGLFIFVESGQFIVSKIKRLHDAFASHECLRCLLAHSGNLDLVLDSFVPSMIRASIADIKSVSDPILIDLLEFALAFFFKKKLWIE